MNKILSSEKETIDFGAEFAKTLNGGEIIALTGDLGAGKTAFTKGLARGLEIVEHVTSPTFTIMNEYRGNLTLYHFDCYRLSGCEEVYTNGLDEYFGLKESVCVIEWPQIINEILNEYNIINVDIQYLSKNTRRITTR